MVLIMKEFDYLVSWVKELCDKDGKAQFESALLEAEAGEKGLPTVWAYIWYKIEDQISASKTIPANPRYIGFLDLCKKNPTLAHKPQTALECSDINGLGFNLTEVMRMKYPDANYYFRPGPLWTPWDQESNETVQSKNDSQESNETVQHENDQPMPMTNFLKDKFDEVSSKYNK